MTLDQMIQFCARTTNTTEDVVKIEGVYSGDALPIVKIFLDGINFAKNKVLKERCKPSVKQDFILGDDLLIDLSTTSNTFMKLIDLRDSCGNLIDDYRVDGLDIIFPSYCKDKIITLQYGYKLPDLTLDNLDGEFEFPKGIVDDFLFCYYAAYWYHFVKGSDRDLDKTAYLISLFNDSFDSIKSRINPISNIYKA